MKYLLVSFFCFIGSVNLYSQVPNYSRITQQNIDRINATQRDREARKADLDRNTMDNISSVSSRNVITNHDCLNALNMGVKNATINELKLYNEMLKNGQLDPNEFSYINSNCVSQFNMAMDYLNSINLKLNQLDHNSESYKNSIISLTNFLKFSEIKFITEYQYSRKYQSATGQYFSFEIFGNNGRFSNYTIDVLVSRMSSLIK